MALTGPRPNYLKTQAGTVPPSAYGGYQLPTPPTAPTRVTTPAAPPSTTGQPTFQPPQTTLDPSMSIASQSDPRIRQLVETLSAKPSTPYRDPVGTDLEAQIRSSLDNPAANSALRSQQTQLSDLLTTLATGGAPSIGDVTNDPAAVAHRVALERNAQRARTEEAARLGASGATGSGDFDARTAQIRENVGESDAAFVGNLASERRQQAVATALSAAGIEANNIGQQLSTEETRTNQRQQLLDTLLSRDASTHAAETQGSQFDRQSAEQLLNTLLGEQGRVQGQAESSAVTAEELRRQELDRVKGLYRPPIYPPNYNLMRGQRA